MSTLAEKIRLAAFLVVAAALAAGSSVFLSGGRFRASRATYRVVFNDSVTGLEEGAPVQLNGVTVGDVRSIDLEPGNIGRVIVTVHMRQRLPLREGTEALVRLQGITGPRFIELSPGPESNPLLPMGGTIEAGSAEMEEWTSRLDDLSAQGARITDRLSRLTSDENSLAIDTTREQTTRLGIRVGRLAQEIGGIMSENRSAIAGAKAEVPHVREAFQSARREIAAFGSAETRGELASTAESGRGVVKAFTDLVPQGTDVAGDTRALVKGASAGVTESRRSRVVGAGMEALDNLSEVSRTVKRIGAAAEPDATATIEAVKSASDSLGDFSRAVRDNPASLLSGRGVPEAEPRSAD